MPAVADHLKLSLLGISNLYHNLGRQARYGVAERSISVWAVLVTKATPDEFPEKGVGYATAAIRTERMLQSPHGP